MDCVRARLRVRGEALLANPEACGNGSRAATVGSGLARSKDSGGTHARPRALWF